MKILKAVKAAIVALAVFASAPAIASQGSCVMPTSGTVSGLTLVQDINACNDAILTSNSGATAPANGTGGVATNGQLWLDTSLTPPALKMFSSTAAAWLTIGRLDGTNSVWTPPIGGGTGTVASATTTDLCSVSQSTLTISGTTTITSFSNACIPGQIKQVTFSGILTLTYNATSMILPNGGSSITTAPGDSAWAAYLGGGNWKVVTYQRAAGTALSSSSVFTGAVFFNSASSVTLGTNTNDWAPSTSANVIHLTCSSAINITGLVAPPTDGQVIAIDNAGATNNCTFTSQDSLSSAANRFGFDRPITLRPSRSMALIYSATAARWRLLSQITEQSIAGGFKGLKITNDPTNGTTINSNLIGTADQVTVEDVNGGAARLTSFSCSASLTTSGNQGLDTGSAATATWYSYWAIFNPTTNTQGCLLSIADGVSTQPSLPSGFTFRARLGWQRTQTSTNAFFLRGIQYGRTSTYVVTAGTNTAALPIMASGNSGSPTVPTYTSVSVSTYVPVTASRIAVALSSSGQQAVVAPNNGYGATNSTTNPPPIQVSANAAGQGVTTVLGALGLESTNIYYAASGGGAVLQVYGWDDNL